MIYVIQGSEAFLIEEKINEIKNNHNYIVQFDGLEDGFSIENLFFELISVDLFSTKKLILIKNLLLLNKKVDEKEVNIFLRCLDEIGTELDVVFYQDTLSINNSLKVVKELKKKSSLFQYEALKSYEKQKYIIHLIETHQLKLNSESYNYLLNNLPYDLKKCNQELLKLSLYPEELTKLVIQQLLDVGIDDNIFTLIDSIIRKKLNLVISRTRDLFHLNIYPQVIISTLASQIRFLMNVHYLQSKKENQSSIASILKQNPYRISKALEVVSRYKTIDLLYMLNILAQLDQILKTNTLMESIDLFELHFIKMINKE